MDYYLEDIARLEGQPKRAIADYVEQNGILVPRRFASLKEAKDSGLPIIARSEHWQDYAGASGILKSPLLHLEYKEAQTEEEVKNKALNDSYFLKPFCRYSGYDEEKFKQEVSFSFWEYLRGCNRVVVADSAIKGRYHVISGGWKGWHIISYIIAEANSILIDYGKLDEELKAGIPALLETYEKIRNLGRFDPNHCPIMEFQTVSGKDYFLQYHRTRDFEPESFVLDRKPVDGEVEMPFVRGVTPPEGMQCKVTVYYAEDANGNYNPGDEDGSWDLDCSKMFSEVMVRRRKVHISAIKGGNLNSRLHAESFHGHQQRSIFFKPQVSLIAKFDDFFISQEDSDRLRELPKKGQNSHMLLDIISDGRRCFVRRVK